MTTATRSSTARFPPFPPANMNGRDDKPAQPIGTSLGASWQPGSIWNNSYAPKRENGGSRGSDEAFASPPTGSGALAAGSEADSWGPWPNGDNFTSRTNSGSNSPNRTRDNPSIFSLDNTTSAIGAGRRPKSYAEDDKSSLFSLNKGSFDYRTHEKRPSQDPSLLGVVGPPGSRDSSIPPSRHSEDSESAIGFGTYFDRQPNPSMSHRPSLPGPSSSFPSPATGRVFADNGRTDFGLAGRLGSMNLDDTQNGLPNGGLHSAQTFPNAGTSPFIPAWATNDYAMNGGRHGTSYTDPISRQYAPKRLSGEPITASPGGYSVASPKSYTPTPEPWAQRPSSRDPSGAPDLERRAVGGFMSAQTQSFYPGFYNPSFAPQFAGPIYDPYPAPHANFRPPMSGLSPYNVPINHYLSNGGNMLRGRDQDPSKAARSQLLEEFRTSGKSTKRFELKDIYNHVVEFSGDQHGSRFIQQKLESANSDEKQQVFLEIEPDAVQLMKDVFGNYVIQKFFEHGSQVQKKVLAEKMRGQMVKLSSQMYACRVVQKALEHVLGDQQSELVRELEPDITKIITDQNGNHVVQKIIELVPRQHIGFIMDSFRGNVVAMASHAYGCRVIQRMLEHGSEQDKEDIMAELHAAMHLLIVDQYGNYVTQHVIQNGKPEDRSKIIKLVTGQLLTLSKHKFASNVVEKCIEYGTVEERRAFREQLSLAGPDGSSPLQQMMKDQYGNYVIQKLLSVLVGADWQAFVDDMRPHLVQLKKVSTGRQIQALDRLLSVIHMPSHGATTPSNNIASTTSVAGVTVPDPSSAAPTPVLTMETNSPRSSSPPSTNASAVGEAVDGESAKSKLVDGKEEVNCPEVRVQEM